MTRRGQRKKFYVVGRGFCKVKTPCKTWEDKLNEIKTIFGKGFKILSK